MQSVLFSMNGAPWCPDSLSSLFVGFPGLLFLWVACLFSGRARFLFVLDCQDPTELELTRALLDPISSMRRMVVMLQELKEPDLGNCFTLLPASTQTLYSSLWFSVCFNVVSGFLGYCMYLYVTLAEFVVHWPILRCWTMCRLSWRSWVRGPET